MYVFLHTCILFMNMYTCTHRGSLFRGLRNLEEDTVYEMLLKVKSKEVLITNLNNECKRIKNLAALQKALCQSMGVECWEEVREKFPGLTSPQNMEKLLHIPPSSAEFQHYCMKVARLAS